jgi:hypothetical protein
MGQSAAAVLEVRCSPYRWSVIELGHFGVARFKPLTVASGERHSAEHLELRRGPYLYLLFPNARMLM